jgi:hypothetical protein
MTTATHIYRIDITSRRPSIGFTVRPYWTNVDRPEGVGYAVKDMRTAVRVRDAMAAGVVFADAEIKTDVNGKTYASARSAILGRTLNADLRRLGF